MRQKLALNQQDNSCMFVGSTELSREHKQGRGGAHYNEPEIIQVSFVPPSPLSMAKLNLHSSDSICDENFPLHLGNPFSKCRWQSVAFCAFLSHAHFLDPQGNLFREFGSSSIEPLASWCGVGIDRP